jgi:hypothetical protein
VAARRSCQRVAPIDKVQRSPGDRMYLAPERLRAIINQALAAGTFVICHDTLTYGDCPDYGPAICRSFFDAYAERSPAGDSSAGLPAPDRGFPA